MLGGEDSLELDGVFMEKSWGFIVMISNVWTYSSRATMINNRGYFTFRRAMRKQGYSDYFCWIDEITWLGLRLGWYFGFGDGIQFP
uniref:Uncharacterized protein n=1 Tax=Cannabis sativa TaxID=3483 RepID=A0A803PKN0_CANSA